MIIGLHGFALGEVKIDQDSKALDLAYFGESKDPVILELTRCSTSSF